MICSISYVHTLVRESIDNNGEPCRKHFEKITITGCTVKSLHVMKLVLIFPLNCKGCAALVSVLHRVVLIHDSNVVFEKAPFSVK